jgi:hypothetical protein
MNLAKCQARISLEMAWKCDSFQSRKLGSGTDVQFICLNLSGVDE